MMPRPKTALELERMRRAGAIVAEALAALRAMVAPGVSTAELDAEAERVIRSLGGTPSFKGYRGYPATVCTSVDEEIVHGIPGARRLKEGEIVSIDAGAIWEGYQGDSAITVGVGQIAEEAQRLIEASEEALRAGIATVRAGAHMGDVSHAIEAMAQAKGFPVVREYGGHGIGRAMHEQPNIPNWGPAGRGLLLKAGMTFALEPMLVTGTVRTRQLADGWTVVTADGGLAAHSEHTVAVTENGAEILTRRDGLASS
ncbi:MAG: type I methionyl aminopeptidase [Anaerolineae bacterium]